MPVGSVPFARQGRHELRKRYAGDIALYEIHYQNSACTSFIRPVYTNCEAPAKLARANLSSKTNVFKRIAMANVCSGPNYLTCFLDLYQLAVVCNPFEAAFRLSFVGHINLSLLSRSLVES